MQPVSLRLKKNQDRRVRAGHCWVYSNEIDTDATPLQGLPPGEPAELTDHRGNWLGSGYVNPHSLICFRLVSRDPRHPLSESLIVHRLNIALALRERLYGEPWYRLVFGEADGLPGLVVDRYGSLLVVQLNTAGMERAREQVLGALSRVIRPSAILLRGDSGARRAEGLESHVECVEGICPEEVELSERGVRFAFSPIEGQKTGWYFDQRENRGLLGPYVQGRSVLDVCSYVGAWGVQAAARGAASVVCLDASRSALDRVERNAGMNGVQEKVAVCHADAFDAMREMRGERRRFDLVLLDPPAFIKRRKDLKEGLLAYRRLNQAGMQLLEREGFLVTSSCSHHLSDIQLLEVAQQAARHTGRSLQLLQRGFQSPDHPVHPAIPETAYLKTFVFRVLPGF